MRNKFSRRLLGRRSIVVLLLMIQLSFLSVMVVYASFQSYIISMVLTALSLTVCLYIVTRQDRPAYKISWVIIIMVLPLFGGLFYIIIKLQASTRRFTKPLDVMKQDKSVYDRFAAACPLHIIQADYLNQTAGFPLYGNTELKYFAVGDEQFPYMLDEMKKAKRYIFLEYFIIERGYMWDSMLEVLKSKVGEGVDVRVIYDDVGCFLKLDEDYSRELEALGIKCSVFNPFHPLWSTRQNNRDHRKILSIDGVTVFTGSSNIADEYINRVKRFGHWKDAGIMVRGDAAWGYTVMFLQMWDTLNSSAEDRSLYLPVRNEVPSGGFIQPYCDSPMDDENVGEHVYIQFISHAQRYLYIMTPYLIVDDNMLSALRLAAKSGVDVRIITPFIPDKFIVHATTRLYYKPLIEAGVKIYEYSPGFLHSKIFVSDNDMATVGTANLDFRSLYLHFECGAVIYKSPIIKDIRDDFLNTLSECHEITAADLKTNPVKTAFSVVLRICAPFL